MTDKERITTLQNASELIEKARGLVRSVAEDIVHTHLNVGGILIIAVDEAAFFATLSNGAITLENVNEHLFNVVEELKSVEVDEEDERRSRNETDSHV